MRANPMLVGEQAFLEDCVAWNAIGLWPTVRIAHATLAGMILGFGLPCA
jgi:hypothetical protein